MQKKLWYKIHWILGITAGIILLVIGTSGAILSFEKEIMNAINKDSYKVEVPNTPKLSTQELLVKFKEEFKDAKINAITFSNDKDSSVIINVAGSGEGREARKGVDFFINPYDANVLPSLVGKDFFGFIFRLHRWLAFEGDFREVGKQIVAISTVSLIVLFISGVVVYWGRIKRAFFKSFTFSFKHKGRGFLSTMHSAVGMWVLPFYLLASLTGLFWSYDWVKDSFYVIAGVEKPQRFKPNNEKPSNKGERGDSKRSDAFSLNQRDDFNFEEHGRAVLVFKELIKDDYSTANLRFPQKGTIYSFSYLDKDPAHFRARNKIEFELNSKEIKKYEKYEDKPLNEKLIGSILPLHTGEYFGIIGQIGMFIASALMSLFTITGFMMYLQRKRKKSKV